MSTNPYAPGKVPAAEAANAPQGRASSWLAVLAALVCLSPLAGVGLYVLGRNRRFALWAIPALVAEATMVVAVRNGWPSLFVAAACVLLALGIGSVVDTLVVSSTIHAPPFRRALVAVLAIFVGERAVLYGVKRGLMEAFSIPSMSMAPTLLVGDSIMVKKGPGEIRRGDVVVFSYPHSPDLNYVGRVIGVADDTIETRSNTVLLNSVALPQSPNPEACSSLKSKLSDKDCRLMHEQLDGRAHAIVLDGPALSDMAAVKVPAGKIFVMGDNRNNSKDSRIAGFVPVTNVAGSAAFIYSSWGLDGVSWERIGRRLRY